MRRNLFFVPGNAETQGMPTPSGGVRRFSRTALAMAVCAGVLLAVTAVATPALADSTTPRALINADTVRGGTSSVEALDAAKAGLVVDVVSGSTWDAMTAAQFGTYQVLIAGDPGCSSIASSFSSNESVWAPVVLGKAGGRTIAGNRVAIGTDPVFHGPYGHPGGFTLIQDGINFASSLPGRTGLYFDATCGGPYGQTGLAASILQQVSTGTGTWTENEHPPCGGNVAKIASTSKFDSLHSSDIQGWGCSVHETFPTFASDWSPLAVATDAGTRPVCGTDSVTGLTACGEAYVLIAGSDIVVTAPDLKLSPVSGSDPDGGTHAVTATVTRSGAPLSGQTVAFSISGINASVIGTCTASSSCVTDSAGQVTFTYTDSNGVGNDTVYATYSDSSSGSKESASAAEQWTAAPKRVLASITVSPASSSVTSGDTVAFTAKGYDAAGSDLGDITSASVFTSSTGTVSGNPVTFTTSGDVTITATDNGIAGTAMVHVGTGALASITVSPATKSVTSGDTVAFTAKGYDAAHNDLGDITSASVFTSSTGTVSGNPVTFTTSGDVTITATDNGIAGTAMVHVGTGALASITVSPATKSVTSGDTVAFTAKGYDAAHNDLGDITSASVFTSSTGTVSGNPVTFTTSGDVTITATDNGIAGTAMVHVGTGALASITVSPATKSVTSGDTVAFTAKGYDAAHNDLGDITSASVFTSSTGTVSGNPVTFTTSGDVTITATDNGIAGTAMVHVGTGALASITVSPAAPSEMAGTSVKYSVAGADAFGNPVAVDSPKFSIAGGTCDGATCTTTAAGSAIVTVISGAITGFATLDSTPTAMQSAAQLGSASRFSVLAGAAVTIGAGATTTGATATGDGTESDSAGTIVAALTDLATAYKSLKALPAVELAASGIGGVTLSPGVYHSTAVLTVTGETTFDAKGDPNAIFILQSDAAINTAAGSTMVLKNGAKAANIFWVTTGAATLGASSVFYGNIISNAAITVGADTTVYGRALSTIAAITIGANSIISTPDIN